MTLTSLLAAVAVALAWIVWAHMGPSPSAVSRPAGPGGDENEIGPDHRDLSHRHARSQWGRPFWEDRRCRAGTGPDGGILLTFTDVSLPAGLVATNSDPCPESSLNPQVKGSGLAVFDADGDGWDDVYINDSSARILLDSGNPTRGETSMALAPRPKCSVKACADVSTTRFTRASSRPRLPISSSASALTRALRSSMSAGHRANNSNSPTSRWIVPTS